MLVFSLTIVRDVPSDATPLGTGYHQPSEAQASCTPCAEGESQREEGSAACESCPVGRSSVSGSATCTICDSGYYRQHADSPSSECTPCSAIDGVSCRSNTTTETLSLTFGYWRHSTATLETWPCKSSGGRSPCVGGIDAGSNGNGYCAAGFRGPVSQVRRLVVCSARSACSVM